MVAAAVGFAPALAHADDIALSLVHPKGRIDIPAAALTRVEAVPMIGLRNPEIGEVPDLPDSQVEVCYSEEVRQRVCQLTKPIVDQPLDIVVGCETVSKPIVREPLCGRCLSIALFDSAEAAALAQRIRNGTNRACAPSG